MRSLISNIFESNPSANCMLLLLCEYKTRLEKIEPSCNTLVFKILISVTLINKFPDETATYSVSEPDEASRSKVALIVPLFVTLPKLSDCLIP